MRDGTTTHEEGPGFSQGERAAVAALAAALTAGSVALALANAPPGQGAISAAVHGLVVATPVTVGLAALQRRPHDRFARLLVVAGLVWASTALAESREPALYSAGRVAVWLVEPTLIYLLLA